MEAEGHGPGAYGLHPVAAVAAWRHHPRTAAAQLRIQTAAQDDSGRVALGLVGEAARWRIESRARVRVGRSQDQKHGGGARQAGSEEDGTAGRSGENANLIARSRNLKGVKLVPTKDVTVYDLLKYKQVLLSEAAAKKLSEALA